MTLVQNFVSRNASERPESLFIKDGVDSISYGAMDEATNRLARALSRLGVSRGDGVALFIPKGIVFFEALIATLKADAYYLPLNLGSPEQRNRTILAHAGCRFVVCDDTTASDARRLLLDLPNVTLIELGSELAQRDSAEPLEYENAANDLAYVLYTSGSTGEPKGVMIRHSNVANYAHWATDFFEITPEDRVSNHPGPHFDLSVFDIYSAMKAGASLHLVPPEASLFPIKIVDFIQENRLTVWNSVPSLYTFIVRAKALDGSKLRTLRALTFNGEVMPTSTLIEWMRTCPTARFVNQYGPTETTCASLFYELTEIPTDALTPIPIGAPLANTQAFALSDDGHLIREGESGELHIGGAGVGSGYLNDPQKTRNAYIRNPLHAGGDSVVYRTGDIVALRPGGIFNFVGRKDFQIKVMGYRVELGDVEAALSSLGFVSSAAALGIPHPRSQDIGIVAFFVPHDTARDIGAEKIKSHLQKLVPDYMVPKVFVCLDNMPTGSNGKIDRVALRALYENGVGS